MSPQCESLIFLLATNYGRQPYELAFLYVYDTMYASCPSCLGTLDIYSHDPYSSARSQQKGAINKWQGAMEKCFGQWMNVVAVAFAIKFCILRKHPSANCWTSVESCICVQES